MGATSGPTPLMVGARFVKHYYKMLSTEPDQLAVLYEPTSLLSNGYGSDPAAEPTSFETMEGSLINRFLVDGFEKASIRFEFENGAIDAQESISGGILLVVTGHVVYLEEIPKRKQFVHTFILLSTTQGTKRSYYVHNDILRFITDDEENTVVVSNKSSRSSNAATSTEVEAVVVTVPEELPKEIVQTTVVANGVESAVVVPVEDKDTAPGGGVEESKEVVLLDEETQVNGAAKKAPPKVAAVAPPQNQKQTQRAETSSAGTWASLVKTNTPNNSAPNTPSRQSGPTVPAVAPSPKPSPTKPPVKEPAVEKKNGDKKQTQRNPDFTLVLKNTKATATASELLALCEPFASKTGAKIVDHFVSASRGLAFVDFDSAAPVLAAVEAHNKHALELNGQKLDVYQKSQEHRNRRKPGGGNRRGQKGGGRTGGRGGGPKEND